ncbi:MAG: glutathione S-transferase family protein [Candidatus Dormibacteraceae bacterium]
MLKLYYSPGTCSLAPHIVLEELATPYQLELVSIAEGKTRTPEYLAINPKGRVPVLVTEEGETLTELPAICWYLSQQASHPLLFPHDKLAGARVLEWCNWLSGTVHAMAFGQIWRPHRFLTDEKLYPNLQAKGRADVLDHFAMIESRLSGRTWTVGNAYTFVDAYLLVFFRWGNRIGLDMRAAYPAWTAHAERVAARPAVQRALQQEGIGIWDKPS